MFELDLLHLDGNYPGRSISPYIIREGVDVTPSSRKPQWTESDLTDGATAYGNAPQANVERTVPLRVEARFDVAYTNVLTNPRPYSVVTGWAAQGTGSTVTFETVNFEDVIQAVTTGSANSGVKHEFTGTVAAYSAGVWVRVSTGTAPIDVKFDGATAASITATDQWQLVKSEGVTLTAATRSIQVLQSDTGSRTIYVKLACVHLGATFVGYFDGACGDARWNGTAHASTSTCLTGQDAVSLAIGMLGEKVEKAIASAGTGGLDLYWQPIGSDYRNRIQCRAVEFDKLPYDYLHGNQSLVEFDLKLICHPKVYGARRMVGSGYKPGGQPMLVMDIADVPGDESCDAEIILTNESANSLRFVAYGLQGRDRVAGTSLIVRAASMGVTGYSGTLTAAINEVQTITKTGTVTGGTYKLTHEGNETASLAHDASNATILAALEALASFNAGTLTMGGGALPGTNATITGTGDLAGCSINPITVTSSALTGGGSYAVVATTAGVPGYVKADLFDEWTAVCDTGNLSLIGSYKVFARIHDAGSTSEIGMAELRLVHGPGDMGATATNDVVSPVAVGDSSIIHLGEIHIDPAPVGTQRYKAKVQARTDAAAGTDLRVLEFEFVPMENGIGWVKAVTPSDGATLSMFDNFSAISGAITGDTATTGQTWASMGGVTDADDFTKATGNAVQRTAVSDASTDYRYGRGVVLGSEVSTDVTVSVNVSLSVVSLAASGVIARFNDNNNFMIASYSIDSGGGASVVCEKIVGGTQTLLGYGTGMGAEGGTRVLSLTVWASGAWAITVDGATWASGYDSALASGTLASGKSGLYDWHLTAVACTRTYSNFKVLTPPTEQVAAYPARNLKFEKDWAQRESSAGDDWSMPSILTVNAEPKLVPSGSEGLTNRLAIMAGQFNPDRASDPYSDEFSVEVYVEPVSTLAGSEG